MRARRFLALGACLLLASCADLWGFDDATLAHVTTHDAGHDAGDAMTVTPRDARVVPEATVIDVGVIDSGGREGGPGGCESPTDCPAFQACNPSTHACSTTCGLSTTECNGGCCDGTTCSGGDESPSTCGANGEACVDCTKQMPPAVCSDAGSCVECNGALDCKGGTPACVDHVCLECGAATDCPMMMACTGGKCSPVCSASSPCNGACCVGTMCMANGDNACGSACVDCAVGTAGRQCVAGVCGCNDNGHCPTHNCDMATHTCQ